MVYGAIGDPGASTLCSGNHFARIVGLIWAGLDWPGGPAPFGRPLWAGLDPAQRAGPFGPDGYRPCPLSPAQWALPIGREPAGGLITYPHNA